MTDLSRYVRHYRTIGRLQVLLSQGKCPYCEMLLVSAYHTDCSYQQVDIKIIDISIEAPNSTENGLTN